MSPYLPERNSFFGPTATLFGVFVVVFVMLTVLGNMSTASEDAWSVPRIPVPHGGIEPQAAVDDQGTIHLVYFLGDANQGDLFYVRSIDNGTNFSVPKRINNQPGSAVAMGVIRGAQIAVAGGHVHVVWNGSAIAKPKGPLNPNQPADSLYNGLPMLYSRSNLSRIKFEPQRTLMQNTYGLDGGGSVAADDAGQVLVAWHGLDRPGKEADRRVWLARSDDHGATFSQEQPISAEGTGSCGCCGLRAYVDRRGTLYVLYRSATEGDHRDIYLLGSSDHGKNFRSKLIHNWRIPACPMTSMSFAEDRDGVRAAWETEGQVYWARVDKRLEVSPPIAPTGPANQRKYPALAANSKGHTLLAWNAGASWGKAGTISWQIFNQQGKPIGEPNAGPKLPKWSFAAAITLRDGSFRLIY